MRELRCWCGLRAVSEFGARSRQSGGVAPVCTVSPSPSCRGSGHRGREGQAPTPPVRGADTESASRKTEPQARVPYHDRRLYSRYPPCCRISRSLSLNPPSDGALTAWQRSSPTSSQPREPAPPSVASTWPWPCPPGHTEWPAPPLPQTSANTASRFGVFFSRLNTRQEEGGVPSCQLPNHCPAPRGGAASSVEGMTASWSGLAPVTTPGLSALGSGESRAIFTSKAGASA